MNKFNKVMICLGMAMMVLILSGNSAIQKCSAMSFESGNRVFLNTWRVNYPDDENTQWYATITDKDFMGLGSYIIDETALPDRFTYRVTLHLNDNPKVFYWVKISEGTRGYGMTVQKVDNAWHHVLNGWRGINQ